MQLEAVFASEIMWTDVLNVRRWKHRSKMIEIRIEAKIAAKSIDTRASLENIRQVDNCDWSVYRRQSSRV